MTVGVNPVLYTERKAVDLYGDAWFPAELARAHSATILTMEAKGWKLIKEENGIGLFEREVRLKVW